MITNPSAMPDANHSSKMSAIFCAVPQTTQCPRAALVML
jgi:hypothetical protein